MAKPISKERTITFPIIFNKYSQVKNIEIYKKN